MRTYFSSSTQYVWSVQKTTQKDVKHHWKPWHSLVLSYMICRLTSSVFYSCAPSLFCRWSLWVYVSVVMSCVFFFSFLCNLITRTWTHLPLIYAWGTMGSVSSLINGNSVNSKHCKASEYRIKKGLNPHRRSGGCSFDGLLKCGFTQGSSSTTQPSKRVTHSGRSEDFFYIKVRLCIICVWGH